MKKVVLLTLAGLLSVSSAVADDFTSTRVDPNEERGEVDAQTSTRVDPKDGVATSPAGRAATEAPASPAPAGGAGPAPTTTTTKSTPAPAATETNKTDESGWWDNTTDWLGEHVGNPLSKAFYGRFAGAREADTANNIDARDAGTDSKWYGLQDIERMKNKEDLEEEAARRMQADRDAYLEDVAVTRSDDGKWHLQRGDKKIDATGDKQDEKSLEGLLKSFKDDKAAKYEVTGKEGEEVLQRIQGDGENNTTTVAHFNDAKHGQAWFGHAIGRLPVAASYAARTGFGGLYLDSLIRGRGGLTNRAMAGTLRAMGMGSLAKSLMQDSKLAGMVRVLLNTGMFLGADALAARAVGDYSLAASPYHVYKHFNPDVAPEGEQKTTEQRLAAKYWKKYAPKKTAPATGTATGTGTDAGAGAGGGAEPAKKKKEKQD